MAQPTAAAQKAAAAKAQEEAEERKAAEERDRRANDTNYNPLLQNGITNKDVSNHLPLILVCSLSFDVPDFQNSFVPLRH